MTTFGTDRSLGDGNDLDVDMSEHAKILASCCDSGDSNSRVLAYREKAPIARDGYQSSLKVLYSQQGSKKAEIVKPMRHIASAPVRILDAPDMLDDYCEEISFDLKCRSYFFVRS